MEVEEEGKEVECSICMDIAEIPLEYRCCKQIICKKCFQLAHYVNKQRACPYCRATPVSATSRNIYRKKPDREPGRRFLISREAMMAIVKEAVLREGGDDMKIDSMAFDALRVAMEEYGIERLREAQVILEANGKRTLVHL